MTGLSPSDYLQKSFQSTLEMILFLILFPIGGIAVYAVRKWSYPVFFLVTAWAFYGNYKTWYYNPDALPIWLLIIATILNFVGVAYILIPEVRKVYMDPSLRWWESKPRYLVDIDNLNQSNEISGKIFNISEGGVFMVPNEKLHLTIGDRIQLKFAYEGLDMELNGEVVHFNPQYLKGYGIRFEEFNKDIKQSAKNLIKKIRKNSPRSER